ncbi:MAG: glycosyl hydrolase family 18 protein [bacterium]
MKYSLTTALIILLFVNLYSQDFISIHQLHAGEFGRAENSPSQFDSEGKDIIPLQYDKSGLTKNVFGYLPDWQYNSAKPYLQYSLLTHIAAFDFAVSSSGSISNPNYWPWTDVINLAHQNGVKIILCAVNFDGDEIHTIMTDAIVKQNFFDNVKSKIQQYQLDGVNIDFESLNTADRGTVVNTFMLDLTNFIHTELPGKEVSFAGPAVNWGGWLLSGLASSCDYIFIMGYAFSGSWSETTGANAPLTGGSYNITNTVNIQYGGINPQKLILGVPYYGNKWIAESELAHASVVDFIGSTLVANDFVNSELYEQLWDDDSQVPWYRWQIDANSWYQVWWDNDISLGLKYDLADSKNYRGVGMWALGYDGSRMELWNLLLQRYYVPVELLTFSAAQIGNTVILKWSTATEMNNHGFEIERIYTPLPPSADFPSREGKERSDRGVWETIGFVQGNGTTTEPHFYSFTDKIVISGNYSYRLKQIDIDGSFTYSKEITVETRRGESFPTEFILHQNYPNPFNPTTTIRYAVPTVETGYIPSLQHVALKIYDILGNEVMTLVDETKEPGYYEVEFDASRLSSGVYFYRLQTESGFNATRKLLVIK